MLMNIWDWHFRVYFDKDLRAQVSEWSAGLQKEEAAICRETLDFYSSFFSFGILIDQITENPAVCDSFLETAERGQDRLLRTPNLLAAPYRKRISKSELSSEQKTRLCNLLSASEHGIEIRSEYWTYLHRLLGANAEQLIRILTQEQYSSYVKLPRQKRVTADYLPLFEEIYSDIKKDPALIGSFGPSAISDFAMQIQEGTAYGEWWDRDLADEGKDRLVLFTSDAAVKSEDYLYTIIHETYPGHGHFYNYVRNRNTSMDHGAILLLEGWATYCEWHSRPNVYTDAVRHNGIVLLHNSYFHSLNDIAEISWHNKQKSHIPFYKALPSLIYTTQYIGYMESYYMGALWLENMINTQKAFTPEQFLEKLKYRDKGEYFRLWQ